MKVGYLQISSEDQAEGLSPEIQRRALIAAGAEEIFEDLGLSGYSGRRRPGFEALMEAVIAGRVSQVICNTYSRLSRNAKDSARLDDALMAAEAISASGRAETKYCLLSIGSMGTPERWLIDTLCLMALPPRSRPSSASFALTALRASKRS